MACPAVILEATRRRPQASHEALLGERSLPRVAISFPVRLHGEYAGITDYARARDLSVAGIGVESPLPFAPEAIRRVTLSTPTGRIELAAEGCWQAETPAGDGFLTGIRFLGVESVALDQLWNLVHRQTRFLMNCLSQSRALQAFDLDDRIQLIHFAQLREIREGDVLYRPGVWSQRDDSTFIVTDGELAIETLDAEGTRIVSRAGPGDILGGLALAANSPPDESATALRDTHVLELPATAFQKLKQANPLLALDLAATVRRCHRARRPSSSPIPLRRSS